MTKTTVIRTDKHGIRGAVLKRLGDGYATPDGRFVIVPVIMGDGANNNGGYSPGHREWKVTDTTGVAKISRWYDNSTAIRTRLYEVRELIVRILDEEAAAL
jgi:hypothetical protein